MDYHMFKDNSGEWRWHLMDDNNQKIANSAEGYESKQDCEESIELVKSSSEASVHEEELAMSQH
ncbi:MAG: hypothetical protein JWM56_313 [Candidatus Peribacteria bacterium]|nr:hypothetical protein [Candidatus Peribacteria bacterium]